LHVEKFASGKGVFHPIDYIPPAELPDDEYPFFLTTGRILYQYHTRTMTMRTKLNDISPECLVEISREDANLLGINENDIIRLRSRRGEIEAKALVTDTVDKGTVFVPFHYANAAANMLTNTALDPVAKIPEYKVCAVRIEKV
jgi:predicted molibdopterin-dependent oxidoreductase YjgC